MKKAVFLDKDGTLIKDVPYNADRSLIKLEEGVAEGLSILSKKDFTLIVISNQSGIAKGFFEVSDLQDINDEIQLQLAEYDVKLNGFYYCPHLPGAIIEEYATNCDCRKPKPGLIYKACSDFDVDPQLSWMIGDILHDVEAGNSAGCKTILINNGNETEWIMSEKRKPDFIVKHFLQAAQFIIAEEKNKVKKFQSVME